jgi:signal transduction histidine kinase
MTEASSRSEASHKDRYETDRRKFTRREDDKLQELAYRERARKLHSLLELGQLIGLDLQLNDMLSQIALKACEVMGADRCTVFLHDPVTDELWSTVALGMGAEIIRIPSSKGVAGASFHTGETIHLENAYQDSRFKQEVDAHTGYHTRSMLCMPLYNRAGMKLGVIQLLNKKEGVFSEEDESFLKTFANHVSFFIEIAQLQKARIDALEQSRKELERLNRAKGKALDHLSHELRTPLAVIQGILRLLKRKLGMQISFRAGGKLFETLERHLNRLLEIQQETDKIIRSYQDWSPASSEPIPLLSFAEQTLERIKQRAGHRNIHFQLQGAKDLRVLMPQRILEDIVEGLLRNAIENTPDEGRIRILLEQKVPRLLLKIQDFGIGITEENQKSIFDGLFHTLETELYTSRRPYDFNAGGKGLDLLRMKVYGQRCGFDLSVESQRCIYLPTDRDLCPGKISACPRCQGPDDCFASGGSTFTVSFPIAEEKSF